jgi:hypothetical protein
MALIARGRDANCNYVAAPANEALRYLEKPTRLNGSFTFPSIYRGDPNDEIDAAWSKITDSKSAFSLTPIYHFGVEIDHQ